MGVDHYIAYAHDDCKHTVYNHRAGQHTVRSQQSVYSESDHQYSADKLDPHEACFFLHISNLDLRRAKDFSFPANLP